MSRCPTAQLHQKGQRGFVPAGQSTQIIIGATPETDLEVMSVVEALYQRFDLKRVFYSAFVRVNDDAQLKIIRPVDLDREHVEMPHRPIAFRVKQDIKVRALLCQDGAGICCCSVSTIQ